MFGAVTGRDGITNVCGDGTAITVNNLHVRSLMGDQSHAEGHRNDRPRLQGNSDRLVTNTDWGTSLSRKKRGTLNSIIKKVVNNMIKHMY